MESDRTRWDERYADRRLAAPTAPEALAGERDLVAMLPVAGRALDLACGTGAQALWLALRGLDVVALDVSPRAVELTGLAAAEQGVADRVVARVHDLDAGLPADLDPFDVVVCQRFRDTSLYRPIVEAVRVGGYGIVTVLSAVGIDGEPGEFHAPAGELGAAFAADDTELLVEREGGGAASAVFRRTR